MSQHNLKIKLTDFLTDLDFAYKINENKSLTIVDFLMGSEFYMRTYEINEKLGETIIKNLRSFIYDYYIWFYIDCLEDDHNEIISDKNNWKGILQLMQKYPEDYNSYINLLTHILSPELFDISDILESEAFTEKCPHCGYGLYKIRDDKNTKFYCGKCNESFCNVECIGEKNVPKN